MSSRIRTLLLRGLALGVATLSLPASNCSKDVGEGDTFAIHTVRVSVKAFGEQTSAHSLNPSISADGRFVAFESDASDLSPNDANGFRDIFVKDRLTGQVENLTNVTAGVYGPYPDDCFNPVISADGNFIAFESEGNFSGPPLVPGNGKRMIYVVNRVPPRSFRRVTLENSPLPDEDCLDASISADGRYVTWRSRATSGIEATYDPVMFTSTDYTNPAGGSQVYVTDLQETRANSPIRLLTDNRNIVGLQGANGDARDPRLSADGNWVSFSSTSDQLVATDTDGTEDVFLVNRGTGAVEVVSLDSSGVKGDTESYRSAVSEDGRYVFFFTLDSDISGNFLLSIVRRDRTLGLTEYFTDTPGLPPPPNTLNGQRFDCSGNGEILIFWDERSQVSIVRGPGGTPRRVSINSVTGLHGDQDADPRPMISRDGRWVAWSSRASNLVPDDTNGAFDAFVHGPLP
jgi:hypothetical protein